MIEGVGRGRKDFYIQNIDGLGVGVVKRSVFLIGDDNEFLEKRQGGFT